GGAAARLDHIWMLIVYLDTDAGHRGLGFAYALEGGGRALKALADDDLTPLLVGEDPLDHERLAAKAYWRLQGIGRRGLVPQAYSAVDLALWDIKGKAAGLPLYKLLGGARDAAPVYGSDTGWLWMDADAVIEASRPYLDQGMMGIKVKVGSGDPEEDGERLTRIREALGEDIWLGVDANQRYDYETALAMGEFLADEIGAAWFEEPLCCEDLEGHVRLAGRLEVPLALGETLFGLEEFRAYLERDAVAVLQPDVTRVGGLTAFLRIAALAERHHCPVAPHLLPEVAVHLACGLPNVRMVEYMPWLYPAFVEPPAVVGGKLVPPRRPGLGLEISPEAVAKYRVEV
ncbi:MAG: mandelate racemase/muconate lactonizing enzyme family protein, partial [Elioraea sp.]|nr:mandelate racemase/muconate lactonizing enzyme family protein [Elioraea sp.]